MGKTFYILKSIISAFFFEKKGLIKNIDVLFFCSDADRGLKLQGKAYSPLIDSVREEMEGQGFRCASVAYPYSKLTHGQAWGTPLSMDGYYYKHRIISSVRNWLFVGRCTNENAVESIYDHLLKLSNAKLLICIGTPAELSRVCRKNNTPCAELLHGMGFKEVEWGWSERKSHDLPRYILTLDAISTKTFQTLGDRDVTVLQIPHPFLKRFSISSRRMLLPKEWGIGQVHRYPVKKILLCLQWGYNGELPEFDGILTNGLYPDCLDELIADTCGQVDWLFRFHPVQITNPKYLNLMHLVNKLCKKYGNVQWKESTEKPLPTVLGLVDGCITMSSMSVYDAAYMGVPSLMLCPSVRDGGCYSDWYTDLIDAGFVAKKEPTKPNILSWIQGLTRKDPLVKNINDESSWDNAVHVMIDSNG